MVPFYFAPGIRKFTRKAKSAVIWDYEKFFYFTAQSAVILEHDGFFYIALG